jgi:hypothetical protein
LQIFQAQTLTDAQGNPRPLYPLTPSYQKVIESPIVIAVEKDQAEFGLPYVLYVGGDFDGDKIKDLLASLDAQHVGIFRGTAEGSFAKTPSKSITVADLMKYKTVHRHVLDLNKDGRDDIVLRLTGWAEKDDRMIVFLSVK